MHPSDSQLLNDALAIWQAGVDAVQPERLMPGVIHVDDHWLLIDDLQIDLRGVDRIAVVGAGKAGAGMVRGLEFALGQRVLAAKEVFGLVSVPADCLGPTSAVELCAGRPGGVNEPRAEGVAAAQRILEIVSSLSADDLCLCLLSGGGSALLPAPPEGISLEEKIAITRMLSSAGASIGQLNTVRQHLSLIKGGGLARACSGGRLVGLIVSDVLGDPLDMIASGPTTECQSSPADALEVLQQYRLIGRAEIRGVVTYVEQQLGAGPKQRARPNLRIDNRVLANNATAVDSAGMEAERRGYNHAMICASASEGPAADIGRHLADMAIDMRDGAGPNCLISGGEPTVALADEAIRGKGGRNQQLALAALERFNELQDDARGVALLSGGTDGEDGPTDAAGAIVDRDILRRAHAPGLDASDYLNRNDAYRYFEQAEGLLKTGPTHTNVCDIRVVTVGQRPPR